MTDADRLLAPNRWQVWGDHEGTRAIDPDGEWVLWADVEKLLARDAAREQEMHSEKGLRALDAAAHTQEQLELKAERDDARERLALAEAALLARHQEHP